MAVKTHTNQRKSKSTSAVLPYKNRKTTQFNYYFSTPYERIMHLQRTIGNRAVGQLLSSGLLQTKLWIGKPNDKYEQEAGHVADRMMSMPELQTNRQVMPKEKENLQAKQLVSRQVEEEDPSWEEEPVQAKLMLQADQEEKEVHPKLMRQVEEEPVQAKANISRKIDENEEETIQTNRPAKSSTLISSDFADLLQSKPASNASTATLSIESRLIRNSASGNPLSDDVRDMYEPLMLHDFGNVRIHTGSEAAQMNRELGAKAFTFGRHIYFGDGQYNPRSMEGKRLLTHELIHIIQQQAALQTIQLSRASEGAASTGEADPGWRFERSFVGRGYEMNPAFWQVTYRLSRSYNQFQEFTQDAQQTAYQKVQAYAGRHPNWRHPRARVTEIRITLAQGVTPSSAVQDLMSPTRANLYAFECYIAASLLQFVGVWHGMTDAQFNSTHADIRIVLYDRILGRDPELHMGGRQVSFNLQQQLSGGTFSLQDLRNNPSRLGRGDWVVLDNSSFVPSGVFQRENATYLGNNRFHGHGINIGGRSSSLFTIDEYAHHLASKPGVSLTVARIRNEVIVRPRSCTLNTNRHLGLTRRIISD